jgi:arylsulfatase
MYHAGWAWAGSTPFRHTKLVASHFGGTRNPLVVSWPDKIKPDQAIRSQFYHVNDIAPTVYDILNIPHPEIVNGARQEPIDGVSMAASFFDADAPENKFVQYFANNGSRGIYDRGWYACTFGPLIPWQNAQKGLDEWDSQTDPWELYDLRGDFSQATDLALEQPEKLEQMKELFLSEAEKNKAFPIGAGNWLRIHPEDALRSPYTHWTFDSSTTRVPELIAPPVGKHSNVIRIEAEFDENANGVLYALGGSGGGLSCFMDDGYLCFEYNLMIIYRALAKSAEKVPAGKHTIVVDTRLKAEVPGSEADIILSIDGKEVAKTSTHMTVPGLFNASETFDVGIDLGSPVARDYFERAPFPFTGKIEQITIDLSSSDK